MKLLNGLFTLLLALFLIIGFACAQDNMSTAMNDTIRSPPELLSTVVSDSVASADLSRSAILGESTLKNAGLDLQNDSETIIPGIKWQKLLGGQAGDILFDIQPTSDGGYIGVGGSGSPDMENITGWKGSIDAWIVKFDSDGAIQWQKLIGDRRYDQGMSIRETSDGGYVYAGYTNSTGGIFSGLNHGDYDAWVVKLDSSGEQEWQKVIGGTGDDQARCIQQTPDGGYIVTGFSDSIYIQDANENFGGTDILVIKLDSEGNLQWNILLGGGGCDHGSSIVQSPDNSGYVLAGYTDSEWIGDSNQKFGYEDILLAKVDNDGNLLWSKLYGGNGWESLGFGNSFHVTDDGGFILTGQTTSNPKVITSDEGNNPRIGDVSFNHGAGDVWVVKFDEDGVIQWESTYGGINYDQGSTVCPSDDGYIISGQTKSSNSDDVGENYGDYDMWVVKVDSTGVLLWQEVLGGTLREQSSNIVPSADGGFLIAGMTYSGESGNIIDPNHGMQDTWLVKLRPRLIVDITDIDLRTYVSGATVSLYDDTNGEWQQTISSAGPVVFEDTGANHQFSFVNGSTYNLTVTADGYHDSLKQITFQHDGQREKIELTAYERPLPFSYSMTMIQKQYDNGLHNFSSLELWGDKSCNIVKKWLGNQEKWSNLFYHKEEDVINYDFGTVTGSLIGYQGLDDATFHWHFGHGSDGIGLPGTSHIPLYNPLGTVFPIDVMGEWDNKNKWVVFESCEVLSDKSWGLALDKSHGIFGYSTSKYVNDGLPESFFKNSLDYNRSLTQSYYIATVEAQCGKIATAIFDNRDQFFNDHFPGHGVIAPDDYFLDYTGVYADWVARTNEPGSGAGGRQQGTISMPWEKSGIASSGSLRDCPVTGSPVNTGDSTTFWNRNSGSELKSLISDPKDRTGTGAGEVLQGSIGQILTGSAIQASVGDIHYNITLPEAPEEIPVMKSTTNPGDIIQYWSDDLLTEQQNVVSESDAPQAALDILQDNGGLPQSSTLSDVNTIYLNEYNLETEEIVSREALLTSVSYSRELNDMPVVGPGGFIHLSLGGDGENLGLLRVWRTATPEGTQKIITPERAVEKLSNGELIEFPQDLINITLSEMRLGYYERGLYEEQDYFEPVWIFTGNTTSSDELIDFYVYARHFVDFTASETNISTYETVSFTDTSETTLVKWYWDFGDGTNSTERNPSHMYMKSGNFTVSLTAWNGFGSDIETKTEYISVVFDKPLNADFNATPLIASTEETIQFHDASDTSPNKWLWDFGDGTNSTLKNPTHEYSSGGNYTVNLTAWNTFGSDTMSKIDYIRIYPDPKPSAMFSSNFSWENNTPPLTVVFTDQSTGNITSWHWDFGDGTNSTERNPVHVFNMPYGEIYEFYRVNLTVTDIYERKSSYNNYVDIEIDFKPDFIGEPLIGPAPLNVSFTDISPPLNEIGEYVWDFGDNTRVRWIGWSRSSILIFYFSDGTYNETHYNYNEGPPIRNITHTYTANGNYSVTLTIAPNIEFPESTTKEFYITVEPVTTLPVPDFSANVTSGKNPLAVAFTDESTEYPTVWSWDFGDGTNSTEQNPFHVYNTAGTYTVSLTATNDIGENTSIKIDYITVLPRNSPAAGFSANITSGKAPLAVSFTDNSTNSPDSWRWNFGDAANSTEQDPLHVYTASGQYTVSLSATNEDGTDTCKKIDYITVEPELPVPTVSPPSPDLPAGNFTATPVLGKEPLTVTFSDMTIGYPYDWQWDFGDGTVSTDQNPVHTYPSAGLYTVTLNATNPYGSNVTIKTDFITVLPLVIPVANFTASPVTGEAPLTVAFTDNSTGNPDCWNWSFGDGEYSGEQNPVHIYTEAGRYTVSLTVINDGGNNTETKFSYIKVCANHVKPPCANFKANPTSGYGPLEVTFTDKSTRSPDEWFWDFGDGTNSTEQNPVHVYNATGTYAVSLTAANDGGSSTKTRNQYIKVRQIKPPCANFGANPTSGYGPLEVTFTDKSTRSPDEWYWDFGDGTNSTEQNPVHIYTEEGRYTVSLTATNNGGSDTKTRTQYIKVKQIKPPCANFGANPTSGYEPLEVTFTDKSTRSPDEWFWDFGDGTNSTEQNPVHDYTEDGRYTVSLTATNNGGSDTETKTRYIKVHAVTPAPTPVQEHPEPVVSGTIVDFAIRLDWDIITDSRLQGYKVVISKNNPNPKYPDDGYMFWITDRHHNFAVIDTSDHYHGGDFGGYLQPGEKYYFSITAVYNDAKVPGNTIELVYPGCGTATPTWTCSPSPTCTCTPCDPHPAPEMTATVTGDNKIRLDWNVITNTCFQGYKVVISRDNPEPRYPNDGYMLWITDPATCSALIDSTMHYNGGDFGGYLQPGQEYYFSITAVYNDAKVPGNVVRLAYPFNPLPTPNTDRPVIRIE